MWKLSVRLDCDKALGKIWGYATILFATTCDYVLFTITFATTYQLHQFWGGFVTILQLMCNYYLFHHPIWMFLRLYSFMNKPPWPISCMCSQNLITNLCTMCFLGMIRVNAQLSLNIDRNYTLYKSIQYFFKWIKWKWFLFF
jgi:hypothetical protein